MKNANNISIIGLAALIGIILLPSLASAQMVCGTRQAIVAKLQNKYGETRRLMGLTGDRGMVEVFASDETGSWTIMVTEVNGRTCLMAAGDSFRLETSHGPESAI